MRRDRPRPHALCRIPEDQRRDRWVGQRALPEEFSGSASRVDIVARACGGNAAFCAANVSDHAPLSVTLNTAGADDDGGGI